MNNRINKESGVVLLLMTVMLLAGTTVLFIDSQSFNGLQIRQQLVTEKALAQAKQAIIEHALASLDAVDQGSLICPDADNDGLADDAVGTACIVDLGWLPFRSLGLSDIRDGHGERLWYALDTDFRASSFTGPLIGDITLDGSGQFVAVVLAPGAPEEGQTNRYENDYFATGDAHQRAAYLEGVNADSGLTQYVSQGVNDRILPISQTAICDRIHMEYC